MESLERRAGGEEGWMDIYTFGMTSFVCARFICLDLICLTVFVLGCI